MTTSEITEKRPRDVTSIAILAALAVYITLAGAFFTFYPQPAETPVAALVSALQEAIAKGQCTVQVTGPEAKAP